MSEYNKLKSNIKQWMTIQEIISNYNSKIKEIKQKKEAIETTILNDLKNNNLTDKKLKIDNQHVFYNQTTSLPSVSLSLVDNVLTKLVNNNTKMIILNEIKKYREQNKTINYSLKKKKIRKGSVRKQIKK